MFLVLFFPLGKGNLEATEGDFEGKKYPHAATENDDPFGESFKPGAI